MVTLLWVGVQRRCLVGFSIGCLALLCIPLGSVAVTAIQIVANFTIFWLSHEQLTDLSQPCGCI